MKWEKFIKLVGNLPVFDSENLLAGVSNPGAAKVQISRWEKAGKLIQLKRGIYLLDEPYRKVDGYEPFIASLLMRPSYISLEKALEYHGLIPESVPVYTCVTTKRPAKFSSAAGIFEYRHIRATLFWGYNSVTLNKQSGFVASAEKALLDFFYLKGMKISTDYLTEMRLQNIEKIDPDKLLEYAKRFNKPGMVQVAKTIKKYIDSYQEEEKTL